jgi:hypothetical protein
LALPQEEEEGLIEMAEKGNFRDDSDELWNIMANKKDVGTSSQSATALGLPDCVNTAQPPAPSNALSPHSNEKADAGLCPTVDSAENCGDELRPLMQVSLCGWILRPRLVEHRRRTRGGREHNVS